MCGLQDFIVTNSIAINYDRNSFKSIFEANLSKIKINKIIIICKYKIMRKYTHLLNYHKYIWLQFLLLFFQYILSKIEVFYY